MTAPGISICAPAFDEEACIDAVVREWLGMLDREGIEGEIVVADDGSRDRTPEILARLAEEDGRVRVVRSGSNQGYGRALRAAIAASRGELVVTMDADGQFDPEDVPRLLERRRQGGYDLVTGCRARKEDTLLRVAADRTLRLLVRRLFGVRVRDPNCALKLIDGSWARAAHLEAEGYPTPTEIVVRAHRDGLAIGEVTVAHRARRGGVTKLRFLRTAVDAMGFLIALRLRR